MKKVNEDKSKITTVLKTNKKPRVIKTITIDGKKHCKNFNKGQDDFCINYTGCKRKISSCYNNCKLYKNK